MSDPTASAPTGPRTPGLARRLLFAVVVAALLGGGTALAIRYAGSEHPPTALPSPTGSATTDPPYQPVVVSPGATPTASPSPSRRPGQRASTPRPSRSPVPAPSPSRVPLFQVPTKGVCAYIDWTPVRALKLVPKPSESVYSGLVHLDDTHLEYLCKGSADGLALRPIGARLFPSRADADATWAAEKSLIDTTTPDSQLVTVPGLGDDAYGYYSEPVTAHANRTSFGFEVLDGNLVLDVVLTNRAGIPAADFERASIGVARGLLARLPRA